MSKFKMTAFTLFCTEHAVDVLALADSDVDHLPSVKFFALITHFWKKQKILEAVTLNHPKSLKYSTTTCKEVGDKTKV